VESIQEKQNQIIDEFNFFQDWSEKYQYLIDLGKSLPDFDQNNRIDSNLINGCQSKVWLNSSFNDNIVIFEADSDAIISKGIISLLIRVFSGHNPKDILEANIDFIEKIGLNSHLSQTNNIVIFEADSDAIISKGIISLLIRVFSGHNPKDILEANIDFIEKIGLNSHLSQTRANGLLSMIKQIKIYALAYQVKK